MENTIFFRLEILIFLCSFLYILYCFAARVYKSYCNISNIVTPKHIHTRKTSLNTVDFQKKEDNYKKTKKDKNTLDDNSILALLEMVKKVQLFSSK